MSTPVDIPSERQRNRDIQKELQKLQSKPAGPIVNRKITHVSGRMPLVNHDTIGTGIDGKISFIREPISGDLNIDFIRVSREDLSVIISGDTTFTFSNIPKDLNLRMYITIGSDSHPSLTVGGVPFDTTELSRADELELEVKSSDGKTVTVQKKTKKSAPTVPRKLYPAGISSSSVNVTWLAPITYGNGLKYELKYSKSRDTDADGIPSASDVVTVPDITGLSKVVSNLDANTIYHFWLKAVDDVGESGWVYNYTDTDPSVPSASEINFRVTAGFLSNDIRWLQPAGRSLKFSLYRENPDGTEIILIRKSILKTVVDTKSVSPVTTYTYRLYIYDETGSLLSFRPSQTVTTLSLPVAATSAKVINSIKIETSITFPPRINLAEIQIGIDSTFSSRVNTNTVSRLPSTVQEIKKFVNSSIFNKGTNYWVRARYIYGTLYGGWSNGIALTTGQVPKASTPRLTMTSPSRGQVRIKIRFQDSLSYGDIADLSYRDSGSVGEYTQYQSYARDNPPSDDLDSDGNRIEVIRSGFTPGKRYTFRVVVVRPQGLTSASDTDNVTIDN